MSSSYSIELAGILSLTKLLLKNEVTRAAVSDCVCVVPLSILSTKLIFLFKLHVFLCFVKPLY